MPRASDGLLAIYVRPPGSPDLAQRLCSAASSLRCRTAAEDGSVAELERSRGHGNLLLTTPTAPATVPSGAFYFVSLTNPLEALSASPPRRNPQCAALLPPGDGKPGRVYSPLDRALQAMRLGWRLARRPRPPSARHSARGARRRGLAARAATSDGAFRAGAP